MTDLSTINEINLELGMKDQNETMDRSEDSGLASSENSSAQSGKKLNFDDRCLIIQFQALNARPDNIRESTFVTNEERIQGNCNLSSINAGNAAETINSEDGKT